MKTRSYFLLLLLTFLVIFFLMLINILENNKDSRLGLNSKINKYDLITHNGEKFNSKFFSKTPAMLFFGFLNCPDVCPATLDKISNIILNLEAENKKVNFYFITVDPLRDTENRIKEYLSNFSPKIVGVTGSEKNINNFLEYMYVYRKKVYLSDIEYTYDHSSQIFMFHKNGDFFGTISLNESNTTIYEKINKIINGA